MLFIYKDHWTEIRDKWKNCGVWFLFFFGVCISPRLNFPETWWIFITALTSPLNTSFVGITWVMLPIQSFFLSCLANNYHLGFWTRKENHHLTCHKSLLCPEYSKRHSLPRGGAFVQADRAFQHVLFILVVCSTLGQTLIKFLTKICRILMLGWGFNSQSPLSGRKRYQMHCPAKAEWISW